MDKATEQLLRDLTKSLGIATEKLIEWFSYRAVATGYGELFTASAQILTMVLIVVLIMKNRAYDIKYWVDDEDNPGPVFAAGIGTVVAFGALCSAVINVHDAIIHLVAPQSSAILSIIDAIKK